MSVESLVPYLSDWLPFTKGGSITGSLVLPGYYVHKGRVYITGAIFNGKAEEGGAAAVGAAIAVVPPAIRPASEQTVVLPVSPIWTTDACNPPLNLPEVISSVIEPDGKWTLSELPASLNAAPSGAIWYYATGQNRPLLSEAPPTEWVRHPQYTKPFRMVLVLGNASWDLSPETDTPLFLPLYAAGLGYEDFTDDEEDPSRYSIHGSRVHLGGHVSAAITSPFVLRHLAQPPSGAFVAIPPEEGDYTTVEAGGRPYPFFVIHNFVVADEDQPIVPTGDTPPLRHLFTDGEGHEYVRTIEGLAERRGISEWEDAKGEFATTLFEPRVGPGTLAVNQFAAPPYSFCPVGRLKLVEGKIRCEPEAHSEECPVSQEGQTMIVDLSPVLAFCLPSPPDWYTLDIAVSYGGQNPRGFITSGACSLDFTGCPAGCCSIPEEKGEAIVLAECTGGSAEGAKALDEKLMTVSISGVELDGGFPLSVTEPREALLGKEVGPLYILPPEEPHFLYKGEGTDDGIEPRLLWRGSQSPPTITAKGSGVGWQITQLLVQVKITPYYERRQDGLQVGESVDLTFTGWEHEGIVLGASTAAMVPRPIVRRV